MCSAVSPIARVRCPTFVNRHVAWTLVVLCGCSSPAPLPSADCSTGVGTVELFATSGWCRATLNEELERLCAADCVFEGPASCQSSRVTRGPRTGAQPPAECFYGGSGVLVGARLPTGCVAGVGPDACPTLDYPAFDAQLLCPATNCRDERGTPRTCVAFEPTPCAATFDEQLMGPAFQCPWPYGTFAGTCGAVSYTHGPANIGAGTGCFYVDGGLSGWSYQSDEMSCPNVAGIIPASCDAISKCDGG